MAPSWTQLIFALSVAMVAYTGIETVSNMAEEATTRPRRAQGAEPRRHRRARRLRRHLGRRALGAARRARSRRPLLDAARHHLREQSRCSASSPAAAARTVLTVATDYVGVLAAAILLIATNAGLIGISRLSWSLAEHRQLPACSPACIPATARRGSRSSSSRCSPRCCSCPARPTCSATSTRSARCCRSPRRTSRSSRCASSSPTHAAVQDRGNLRWRGAEIPISAVFGGLGTFAAWISVVVLHSEARLIGLPWMVSVSAAISTTAPPGARPARAPQIAHSPARRLPAARLPHRARPDLRRRPQRATLTSAAKLIGSRRRRLRRLRPRRAPPAAARLGPGRGGSSRPLDPRRRADPGTTPRHQGPHQPHPHPQRRQHPRRGGRRIDADVIYLSTRHAPPSEQRIGPIASYLLDKRPCRIVIETDPTAARALARA